MSSSAGCNVRSARWRGSRSATALSRSSSHIPMSRHGNGSSGRCAAACRFHVMADAVRARRPTDCADQRGARFVCRACVSPQQAGREGFYDDVVRALEARIAERLDAFEEMGLVGADYFVSAIGPAFEVFAQYSRIVKLSGEEVDVDELMVLARQAVARHAMRRLLGADPLASLDADSLFYLTWRWAYLTASIPADEAYKLERAFDVDLGHLARPSGFARQSGSTFALLGPHERKGMKLVGITVPDRCLAHGVPTVGRRPAT